MSTNVRVCVLERLNSLLITGLDRILLLNSTRSHDTFVKINKHLEP